MHFGSILDSWNIDLLDTNLDSSVGHGLIQISPRCLEDVLKDEKLLRWRSVEDALKTFWRPTNVC